MHRHHGDYGRNDKFFAYGEFDGDWAESRSRWDRGKARRSRNRQHEHRPHEKYSRSKRIDWFEEYDDD